MNVRFHVSLDLISSKWHLEAHDNASRRWFVTSAAAWPIQLQHLCGLGIAEAELQRLEAFAMAGGVSTWVAAIEVETAALVEGGFVLQPTLAAIPRPPRGT
jgi:hypothetical protein